MQVTITHHKNKISWNNEWVFIGKRYSNLEKLSKKIKGERVHINKYLHKVFDREIKKYLIWTEEQRVINGDSEAWWMTDLAGKNNLNSDFFLFICQIYSTKEILKDLEKKNCKELLIISDDLYLIKSVNDYLKKEQFNIKLKLKYLNKVEIIKKFKIYIKLFLSVLSSLHWICLSKFISKNNHSNLDNVILFHHSMDVNQFKKNLKLENRYFPNLKSYLLKKTKRIYHIVWFYNFWSQRYKVLKNINKNDGFIAESFLNLKDLFFSVKNFFNTKKVILNCNNYYDIKTKYLLIREAESYFNDSFSNLRFWFYKSAIKKWSSKVNSLVCIDHYENMVFEHALIGAIRNLNIKKKTIYGYHHTLASKEFTSWQSLISEWESKFKPDFVISCGKLSTRLLKSQGNPASKIIDGPALRYHNLISQKENSLAVKNYNKILFPLSKIKDSSLELIDKTLVLGEMLSETSYQLIIKPHPDYPIDKNLLKNLQSNYKNISISEKNIDYLLNECGFSVFMATGASYDALLKGSITLTLRSELNLSDNYLDIFQENYEFVKTYDLFSLKKLLIKLNNDKTELEIFKKKYIQLKDFLNDGFNKNTEEKLELFSLLKNGN